MKAESVTKHVGRSVLMNCNMWPIVSFTCPKANVIVCISFVVGVWSIIHSLCTDGGLKCVVYCIAKQATCTECDYNCLVYSYCLLDT